MREPTFWRLALSSGEMLYDLREEKGTEEMVAHRLEAEACVSMWGWYVTRRFD
jgi:hypothetical protein